MGYLAEAPDEALH